MAQHRADRPRPPHVPPHRPPHPSQLHPDHPDYPLRRVPTDPPRRVRTANPASPPTRLDPFPGRPLDAGVYPSGSPTDVPEDVDAATVYVPSTGELRRPLEAYRDPADRPDVAPDEPSIVYDGVASLVVFVVLVIVLVVGLLVVVPWVLT